MNHPGEPRRSREDPGVVAHHGRFEPVTTPVVRGLADMRAQIDAVTVAVRYEGEGELIAGSSQQFSIEVRCATPLPAGARLAFARRWPSDWGLPQWHAPEAPDYVHVESPVGTATRWWNTRLHPWHPFDHILMLELLQDHPADVPLRARFGDARAGSPGVTVQTFIEEASPLSIRLLPHPDGIWREIGRPTVRIVGGEAARLVLTLPSRVTRGQPVDAHLRAEDCWGNPARLTHGVRIRGTDAPRISLSDTGWCRFPIRLTQPGWHRLEALSDNGLSTVSNPVQVSAADPGDTPLLAWGDLHAQSVIGCGARTIDQYFAHARDFTAGDFASHQANCFLVSGEEWQETQRSTREAQRPGQFVTLLGVEWSGASRVGGDHNLYFSGDGADLRRCSHEFVSDKSDAQTDLPHINDVFAHYHGTDLVIAAHVGGRTADLQYHDASVERLIEVHSTHATSEWFWLEALRRKRRMGVIAGSDSVDGRPGGSHPGRMGVRNVRGGLTAVEMPQLSRAALLQALRERRCYATTGARIALRFWAGPARMGDEVPLPESGSAFAHDFQLQLGGTAPIEAVDFFRDDALLETHDCYTRAASQTRRLRVAWRGASAPGNWQRARMNWDGGLYLSGGQIGRAEPWAFDTPAEGILAHDAHSIHWRSITAGDWDGVILDVDAQDLARSELRFASEPLSFSCRLDRIGPEGWQIDETSPDRSVQLRWLPDTEPARELKLRFRPPTATESWHAYWVRVRQSDGEIAWSSPIFVQHAR